MKPPEMEVFFSLLFFTNECLYYNIVNAVYGGCGEGVNTPGCEPGIRQFKSDHPPQKAKKRQFVGTAFNFLKFTLHR